MLPATHPSSTRSRQSGFTLVELLVSMAITTVIMGATMTAMQHAINATDSALLLTSMNNGLRTSMDLMVRDLLQVGQGLPSGHVVMVPAGPGAQVIRMPGPSGLEFLAHRLHGRRLSGGRRLHGDLRGHAGTRARPRHRRSGDRHDHDAAGGQRVRPGAADRIRGRRCQHRGGSGRQYHEPGSRRHPSRRSDRADEGELERPRCRSHASSGRTCSSTPAIR